MCGIAGIFDTWATTREDELRRRAENMGEVISHRGPDSTGLWLDVDNGLAMAHRRLRVIDLSPTGDQPMTSGDGRWTITYNGELYNFRELRNELSRAARSFAGTSDTEVFVEAVAAWGIEMALERSIGMFAVALWDARDRTLHLARDRLGEKPLYIAWLGGTLLWASELTALRLDNQLPARLDEGAATDFLRFGFVPGSASILEGVQKLAPGCRLEVTRNTVGRPEPRRWWSLEERVEASRHAGFDGSTQEAVDELDALLHDAVARRIHADVPLGAFLSGGLDSSTVVAIMSSVADRPPRTFTVAFESPSHDEAEHAARVARRLGTEHTEVDCPLSRAEELATSLPTLYDEPFADPSALPTAVLATEARRHVTVCLSGDGGDELFGGYNRYTWGQPLWDRMQQVPWPLRRAARGALLAPPHRLVARATAARPFAGRLPPNPADKVQKLALLLGAEDEQAFRNRLVGHWDPAPTTRPAESTPLATASSEVAATMTERLMLFDTTTTLPDDMLVKVDRASMAVGLEVRLPLLDHRVLELAWRLPVDMHIRGRTGKQLLRRILDRHLPGHLDRPKMGFDPPLGAWLRGPLRAWAEDLLDPARLAADGFLDPDPIRRRWQEHLAGRRNWEYPLWTVLTLQGWRDHAGV